MTSKLDYVIVLLATAMLLLLLGMFPLKSAYGAEETIKLNISISCGNSRKWIEVTETGALEICLCCPEYGILQNIREVE